MKTDKPVTAVFGSSKPQPGSDEYQLAFDLGTALAKNGITIINGGYGGTMLASAKGASIAGANTIGVTCSAFGTQKANRFIKQNITTDSLEERLKTLISLARAYIVLPGGTGTLLELANILELKNKNFIDRNTPLIIITDFWQKVFERMERQDPDIRQLVVQMEKPHQVAIFLKNYFENV